MPQAVAAGIASTALTAPVVAGGLGTALGTGLAAGSAMAGTGIFSNFMAGAAPGLAGSLGGAAITPTVASLAPAATAQAMGPSMLQSAGLDALKSQAIGGGMLPGAGQGLASTLPGATSALPGVYNPATAETLAAKFLANSPPIANPNNLNFLNSSVAGGNTMPLETLNSFSPVKQGLDPSVLQRASLSNPTASPLSTTQAVNPADIVGRSIRPGQNFMQNLGNFFQDPSMQAAKDYASEHPYATSAMAGLGAMGISKLLQPGKIEEPESNAMIRPYTYERTQSPEAYATSPTTDSSERNYFNNQFIAGEPYRTSAKAEGGIASAYAVGGPVEQMAAMNATGANTGYPMADLQTSMYANPSMQRPEATNVIAPSADAGVGAYTGAARFYGGGITYSNAQGRSITNWGEDGGSNSKSLKQSPGYKYSYDPNTMQFTQLSKPVLGYAAQVAPSPGTYDIGGRSKVWTSKPTNITSGGIDNPAISSREPQSFVPDINIPAYQNPEQELGLGGFYNTMDRRIGSYGGYAKGGNVGSESHLGDYSDGGRLLKGPGDGVSDSIPASIGGRQPARLADGEFVVPARIVSELGNGSTEAGARKLYAMMERVQATRRKSIGKKKVAVNSKADKHLPA